MFSPRKLIAILAAPTILLVVLTPPNMASAESTFFTTATQLLGDLRVTAPVITGYDRALFPQWIDEDGDGCDTRAEVLKMESAVPVTVTSGCTVVTGQWTSPYDGLVSTNASDVNIDHTVPLGEAWASGANAWTAAQRQQYANELSFPYELIAVTKNVNESKGDRDPATWLPPDSSYRCRYVQNWIQVKISLVIVY